MATIHPTAIIDPTSQIGDDVEIGPYAIIEADTVIGNGAVIRPHAVIRQYTTLGENNFVDSFTSLGGEPQDLKFDPSQVSRVIIGDNNTFREGVTISRATGDGEVTRVGSNTYWMANSHAGHNATIEDNVILVNGSLVAGHATIGNGTIISGGSVVHQFCWVGERCMFQGLSGVSAHLPPYCMVSNGINRVASLNVVGLRRAADLTNTDRVQIKEAFRLLYRSKMTPGQALKEMQLRTDWGTPAGKFRDFVDKVLHADAPYNRGLPSFRKSS